MTTYSGDEAWGDDATSGPAPEPMTPEEARDVLDHRDEHDDQTVAEADQVLTAAGWE